MSDNRGFSARILTMTYQGMKDRLLALQTADREVKPTASEGDEIRLAVVMGLAMIETMTPRERVRRCAELRLEDPDVQGFARMWVAEPLAVAG